MIKHAYIREEMMAREIEVRNSTVNDLEPENIRKRRSDSRVQHGTSSHNKARRLRL